MWAQFFSSAASGAASRRHRPWNARVRQAHRCLAILFTLTVSANFVAMALGPVPDLIVYSPLIPLFLLMLSGLYMFALTYLPSARGSKTSEESRS